MFGGGRGVPTGPSRDPQAVGVGALDLEGGLRGGAGGAHPPTASRLRAPPWFADECSPWPRLKAPPPAGTQVPGAPGAPPVTPVATARSGRCVGARPTSTPFGLPPGAGGAETARQPGTLSIFAPGAVGGTGGSEWGGWERGHPHPRPRQGRFPGLAKGGPHLTSASSRRSNVGDVPTVVGDAATGAHPLSKTHFYTVTLRGTPKN